MLRFTPVLALIGALLAGCSNFPELNGVISPAAQGTDYPSLLPIDQIITGAQQAQFTGQTSVTLQARANRLRARADRLRGPVIDRKTRTRMRRAIARHR